MTDRATPSLWRHRDFMLLWAGETVSHAGTAVGRIALPLLAATTLAATPFEMGLLTAAGMLAFLLVGLQAGAWLDRVPRRPVMLAADVARGLLALTVPLAWWAGVLTLAQVLVVALLIGVATVFFDVAYQSYLPSLVGRQVLVDGNSKLESTRAVSEVAGPPVGGGLVQWLGAANTVLADAVGYFASAAALAAIRTPEPPPEPATHARLRSQIAEGLRFVGTHPLLRPIVSCTATFNFFGSIQAAVVVLFLVRELGLSAGTVGLLFAAGGIGGVVGAMIAGRVGRLVGQARIIWLSVLVTAPFALLIPLGAPGWRLALIVVGEIALGVGVVLYNVAQVSFRQAICPDRLLGRMNASVRFIVFGTAPLGGLVGGVLGETIGVHGALWVGVGGEVLAVAWVLFSPLRTMRDLPEVTDQATSGEQERPAPVG
ncbi:MAG TPA: MFS transporter [Pseudonocardiaceae bacterium]